MHRLFIRSISTIAPDVAPVIGLEVHAQLNIKSKLFSQGSNSKSSSPNSQLDLFDICLPGTLPKFNKHAVEAAILTGLALGCTIQNEIHFDRKNYFYTDMPAGYQITQFNKPIAKDGHIEFITKDYISSRSRPYAFDIIKHLYLEDDHEFVPYIKRSKIKQLQLEQDSAKTLYQVDGQEVVNNLVDYNRSGVGLIEIVFEPDLTTHHEASSLIKELITILKAINTCDCELQDGSLRVDANISIASIAGEKIAEEVAGRVELKNLNSIKSLNHGIVHEINRQASIIKLGGKITRESRTYDTKAARTVVLREKETTVDYRYVPEPNLPPLLIDSNLVNKCREHLPAEMPCNSRDILSEQYNLDLERIASVLEEPGLKEYLVKIMDTKTNFDANDVADFLIYSISNLKTLADVPFKVDLRDEQGEFMHRLSPIKMQELFEMLSADEISYATAYEVMKCIYTSGSAFWPRQIVKNFNWFQISDEKQIDELCAQLIEGMPSVSKQYKKRRQRRQLRMMLAKLCELHNNRISIRKALKCLENRLAQEKI